MTFSHSNSVDLFALDFPSAPATVPHCTMHYRQPAVAHRERATGRPAARHGRPALDAAHREGRDQVPVRHADVSPTFVAATAAGGWAVRIGSEMRRRPGPSSALRAPAARRDDRAPIAWSWGMRAVPRDPSRGHRFPSRDLARALG